MSSIQPWQPEQDRRPKVFVNRGEMDDAVRRSANAIGDDVFVRGGRLVRLARIGEHLNGGGSVSIYEVDKDYLRYLLTKQVNFRRIDRRYGDGSREIDCPKDLAAMLLAAVSEFDLRQLRGLAHAPLIRPDGSMVQSPGYDPATTLYFDFSASCFPAMDRRPTQADAADAVRYLAGLIRYFPFTTEADQSVAIAAVLTAIQRPVLQSAPMHVFDSPTPGTGKSKLAAVTSTIATGSRAAVMSVSTSAEETNKRLDSAIIAGDQVLVLDNIEAPLGGDKLCSLLSEPAVTIRPLGSSSLVQLPTSMTVLATGNNIRLKGDVTRRAIVARLDAGVERPEQRAFDQDVVAEALEDRWGLIAAVITIVLAYYRAGCPPVVRPLGSFETWDQMVRAPLVWAGCADPVQTMERLREDDPGLGDLKALMGAWFERFGAEKMSVTDVVRTARNETGHLLEALEAVGGERGDINGRKIGHYLRRYADRIVSGLRITTAGESRAGAIWRIESVPA